MFKIGGGGVVKSWPIKGEEPQKEDTLESVLEDIKDAIAEYDAAVKSITTSVELLRSLESSLAQLVPKQSVPAVSL